MTMIKTIGVIGAGQMGSGIAHVAALSGYDVIAVDRSEPMLDLLREKATAAGANDRIDVRVGDLTTPGVDGTYDRVLIPFRSHGVYICHDGGGGVVQCHALLSGHYGLSSETL